MFSKTTSPSGWPSSNHNCYSTIFTYCSELGQAIWLSSYLYSALSGNGFSDSDLFLCPCSLSLLWRLGNRDREREREGGRWGKEEEEEEGKKTSLTEAQSIISQVFDWSDCKRSRQFPRALDEDVAGISHEQNPIQQKWRNSSFE